MQKLNNIGADGVLHAPDRVYVPYPLQGKVDFVHVCLSFDVKAPVALRLFSDSSQTNEPKRCQNTIGKGLQSFL